MRVDSGGNSGPRVVDVQAPVCVEDDKQTAAVFATIDSIIVEYEIGLEAITTTQDEDPQSVLKNTRCLPSDWNTGAVDH